MDGLQKRGISSISGVGWEWGFLSLMMMKWQLWCFWRCGTGRTKMMIIPVEYTPFFLSPLCQLSLCLRMSCFCWPGLNKNERDDDHDYRFILERLAPASPLTPYGAYCSMKAGNRWLPTSTKVNNLPESTETAVILRKNEQITVDYFVPVRHRVKLDSHWCRKSDPCQRFSMKRPLSSTAGLTAAARDRLPSRFLLPSTESWLGDIVLVCQNRASVWPLWSG